MNSQLELSVLSDIDKDEELLVKELALWLLKKLEAEEIKFLKDQRGSAFNLEIFLLNDEKMPKNVLSFEAAENFPRPDLSLQALGEIHLNPDYIRAHEESLAHMLIHGFLHLLGYEHESGDGRMLMEHLEMELQEEFSRKP